ncbi:MAG TPA: orotate phosphoribosyltransferase [Miltoncostaeaceae bacterium]|nr:orotate phosphoribosyltransferase [Miltoncostaeaceae bacterium]
MPAAPDRRRLATLLREYALVRESVVLASGRRSSFYFDARQVLLEPEGAALAGALAWEALRGAAPSAVGGLTLGADPLVCAVSAAAWAEGRRVTGFFVRKEAKKHGLQQWIEGPFIEEGTPVAVVDDVLTSGGSLVTAVEKARQAGGVVVAALVVIDRDEGGRDAAVAALGDAPLHALFTAPELLEAGRSSP